VKLAEGWRFGNDFAVSALAKQDSAGPPAGMPTQKLLSAWRWNFDRANLMARIGATHYAPCVKFGTLAGETITLAVWLDGLPAAIPRVDQLFVVREKLAPRRLFSRAPDKGLASFERLRPMLEKFSAPLSDGALILDYTQPPRELVEFVRALPAQRPLPDLLSADRVLDAESLAK